MLFMPCSDVTKQLMAESLKKLMKKTPFNKISIHNIVEDCGLTRQAFYYHFQDVYELLGWIYSNEALEYGRKEINYETWEAAYLEVFEYIEKNKQFCMNTLNSIGRGHLERFLIANTATYLTNIVNEVAIDMHVTEKNKKFIVDFYTPAFIAVLVKWMEDGMKEDPHNVVQNVGALVGGNIKKALTEYEKKWQ